MIVCYVVSCFPLLIQQKVDGSNFFNRSWEEFKVGFNDSRGNYWFGNERLHQQTSGHKLRFDLQARNGSWYYAEYRTFVVYSETVGYKIRVSGYSGNAGDAFGSHDGMMFTTYDRDNDPNGNNCAVFTGGGFWHKYCSGATVNGISWNFRWLTENTGTTSLQSSHMWLVC